MVGVQRLYALGIHLSRKRRIFCERQNTVDAHASSRHCFYSKETKVNGPVKPLIFTGFLRTLSKMVDIEETVVYVKNRHEQYEAKMFRRITRRTAMIFLLKCTQKNSNKLEKRKKKKSKIN